MAEERKKLRREEELAEANLDEIMGETPKRKQKSYGEEPEAFGAFEAPEEVAGEEFRVEMPKRPVNEERPRIRERILNPWEEPMEYERQEPSRGEYRVPAPFEDLLPKLSYQQHKTTILIAFAVLYLVFIGNLTYLFFFNTGLEFGKTPLAGGKSTLSVKNASQHAMHDVTVSYRSEKGETRAVLELTEFPPGAAQALDLAKLPRVKNVELVANARYHQTVTASIALEKISEETRLRSSFRVPKVAFVGQKFQVTAEICNEAAQPEPLQVEESHDAGVFEESPRSYDVQLLGEQCAEVLVSFTPKKAGRTVILFNIVSRDNTEKQEIEVEVRE